METDSPTRWSLPLRLEPDIPAVEEYAPLPYWQPGFFEGPALIASVCTSFVPVSGKCSVFSG
jgi:hypothetical protein